jgi:hypothetical protein
MLLLHPSRSSAINTQWILLAGFNTTFGISSKKFELMGITVNSLRHRANPVCLAIVKQETAEAYAHMYSAMEGGNFESVHKMKLCKPSKGYKMCDAVREQIEQGSIMAPMRDILRLMLPKPKKNMRGEEVPFKFDLPLEKTMCDYCDDTTQGRLDSLAPGDPPSEYFLETCTVFARPEVNTAWEVHIQDIVQAAEEEKLLPQNLEEI